MSEELIDIYDGTGKPLGIFKPKSEVHKNGYWHKSFHCWVIYKGQDGHGYIVLQKRSSKKKSWPNKFDITAAGHYIQGEGIEGGLREIKEELGVDVDISKLISVGVRVCVEDFDPKMVNHEFQDIFFLIDDRPLSSYKMSPSEVTGLVAIKIDDALSLFSGSCKKIIAEGYEVEETSGDFAVRQKAFEITADDFIPTLDNYNYKIMILANRILAGEKHLLI
jgi:isopentenyldiphosphate isomerase